MGLAEIVAKLLRGWVIVCLWAWILFGLGALVWWIVTSPWYVVAGYLALLAFLGGCFCSP